MTTFFASSVVRKLKLRLRPPVLLWSVIHVSNLTRSFHAFSTSHSQAPEPMLPNYGVGNMRMYQQDMTMLIFHNAKERTLQNSLELS